MNFKKPTKKTLVEAAALTVGAVGGAAASRVIFGEIPFKAVAEGKTDYMKVGVRVAFIALGTLGSAAVTGTDAVSSLTKGSFAGMAIEQGIALIKDFAEASPKIAVKANSASKADLMVARAVGLNCACDSGYSAGMGRPKRALRATVIDMSEYGVNGDYAMQSQPLNSYEAKALAAKKYA